MYIYWTAKHFFLEEHIRFVVGKLHIVWFFWCGKGEFWSMPPNFKGCRSSSKLLELGNCQLNQMISIFCLYRTLCWHNLCRGCNGSRQCYDHTENSKEEDGWLGRGVSTGHMPQLYCQPDCSCKWCTFVDKKKGWGKELVFALLRLSHVCILIW